MDIDYVYNEINLMELLWIEIKFTGNGFFFLQLDLKSFSNKKKMYKKQDRIVYVDEVSYLKLKSFYFVLYMQNKCFFEFLCVHTRKGRYTGLVDESI